MDNVAHVEFTTCMGLRKDEFKHVYFALIPNRNDEDFERAWALYVEDKARHIAELNGK